MHSLIGSEKCRSMRIQQQKRRELADRCAVVAIVVLAVFAAGVITGRALWGI